MVWLHYIGGYYTQQAFVEEARCDGISRRIAPASARAMSYGDIVNLLTWGGGKPEVFADFVVSGIAMDGQVSEHLADELLEEGKAEVVFGGGGVTIRRCGMYVAGASYVVKIELNEVVKRACAIAQELQVNPTFLLQGRIGTTFDPPVSLTGRVKFFRGFKRWGASHGQVDAPIIQGIHGYRKRRRLGRVDCQISLPRGEQWATGITVPA